MPITLLKKKKCGSSPETSQHEIFVNKDDSWQTAQAKIAQESKTERERRGRTAAEEILQMDHRWVDALWACASGRKFAVTEKG